MDIKTDIFNNVKKFLSDLDAAEQLNSLRLTTAQTTDQPALLLSAFTTTRNIHRQTRGQSRGRGLPTPQKQTFCKVCYDNEKGKSTYLSHTTESNTWPTRAQLNAIVDKYFLQEVLEQESVFHRAGRETRGAKQKKQILL